MYYSGLFRCYFHEIVSSMGAETVWLNSSRNAPAPNWCQRIVYTFSALVCHGFLFELSYKRKP